MAGEGGMITTDNLQLARRLRLLRNHGMARRYVHELVGYNFRLSDIHAALGLAQLVRLEEFTARRRYNAVYLSDHITSAITPQVRPGYQHVWHQYTIRLPGRDRDAAVQQLNAAGVGTGVFYPLPATRQQPLIELGYAQVTLPVTEKLAQEVLSLPVHPLLSQTDLETIVAEVNRL
jgi:perosamine synthetase